MHFNSMNILKNIELYTVWVNYLKKLLKEKRNYNVGILYEVV